jgi:hypothetical protein
MFPIDVIRIKIQMMSAGKRNNLSFFLGALIFVDASRAVIICSHEQTGARRSDC